MAYKKVEVCMCTRRKGKLGDNVYENLSILSIVYFNPIYEFQDISMLLQ